MEKLETEECLQCGRLVEISHDVENDGYEIECPYCGAPLLLCGACLEYGEKSCNNCDWSPKNGCRRQKEIKK